MADVLVTGATPGAKTRLRDLGGGVVAPEVAVAVPAGGSLPVQILSTGWALALSVLAQSVAASATYTAATVDGNLSNTLTGIVQVDRACTILIDASADGVTWYAYKSTAAAAAGAYPIQERFLLRYSRLRVTNGDAVNPATISILLNTNAE